MTGGEALAVAVRRRVHPGLTLDVALDLGREFGVLVGPSGAGKTTLLRLIAGLEAPDEGTVIAGGATLTDRSRRVQVRLRDRGIGYVFQHDVLFPHLDVAANLRYGLRGLGRAAAEARAREVAGYFGVGPLLARRVGTLSGGERQRVGLARAVAPRPRLLLCDEPVSALDLDARYLALDRLRTYQRAEGTPVLLVTHAMDEALAFGDRLFVLRDGRVVATGRPGEVVTRGAAGPGGLPPRWNVFEGAIEGPTPGRRASTIRLAGGAGLVVAPLDLASGSRVFVRVHAEEIVLARGPIGTLSAQNLLPGVVEAVRVADQAAEVAVRAGGQAWAVAVIAATVEGMGLAPGVAVTLIIKARSCHPFFEGPP